MTDCTCDDHDCTSANIEPYHHYASGCLDCDCEALGPDPCPRRPETALHAAPARETVKAATLWDGVLDTFKTETELNGWNAEQGRLF